MLFGVILGRAVCGLLCPFGLVQDLLHKVPLRKRSLPPRLDRVLRWLKYVVLALLVILLPALIAAAKRNGVAVFLRMALPAGTLGGALPLMATNPAMRALAGALFSWKFAVLVLIVVAAMVIPRPFCRYLCPLGAFYSLFNRVSFYGLSLNTERCVDCGRCAQVCPMGVDVRQNTNSPECIRCGQCKAPVQRRRSIRASAIAHRRTRLAESPSNHRNPDQNLTLCFAINAPHLLLPVCSAGRKRIRKMLCTITFL